MARPQSGARPCAGQPAERASSPRQETGLGETRPSCQARPPRDYSCDLCGRRGSADLLLRVPRGKKVESLHQYAWGPASWAVHGRMRLQGQRVPLGFSKMLATETPGRVACSAKDGQTDTNRLRLSPRQRAAQTGLGPHGSRREALSMSAEGLSSSNSDTESPVRCLTSTGPALRPHVLDEGSGARADEAHGECHDQGTPAAEPPPQVTPDYGQGDPTAFGGNGA